MKIATNLLVFCFFVLTLSSCSKENLDDDLTYQTELIIPDSKTIEIEILELINNHRITKGLNVLNSFDLIKSQTYSHSDYMTTINDVNHDYFYNRKSFLVANANALRVSENVAYGYSSAESVVNAWINSDDHRENIEGDFTDFEVSAEKGNDNKWYFTNIFIKK